MTTAVSGVPANESAVASPQSVDNGQNLSPSPDNPSRVQPKDVAAAAGISEQDIAKFIEIITLYRTNWSADRQLRIAQWIKNVMYDRGQQVIAWDPAKKTYFDVLAWARQQGDSEEDVDDIERFINNITQMLKNAFVGTLSRSVPPTVIRPENAEVLTDVTTAQAAQQAISIIERMNKLPSLVRMQSAYLFLFGVYFKQTRFVLDGDWAGYDEYDVYGEVTLNKPHRMVCDNCHAETPMTEFADGGSDSERACPGCDESLGPQNFWPEESHTGMGVVDTEMRPKGMVKWSIHSPLEIDVDPIAKDLNGTPLLAKEVEIDIAEARAMYPNFTDMLKEGAESKTSPIASYERLRRQESRLMAQPQETQRVTLSEVWLRPRCYWKKNDREFAKRMTKLFPRGIKITQIGDVTVDIREKALNKEWSCGRQNDEHGLLPPATADIVVSFNERFNEAMDIIDDYYVRVASGLTVVNGGVLDERKMSGMTLEAGKIMPIYTKGEGQRMPISEILHQFSMSIDKSILEYPTMILNFAQMLSGCVPQVFGDTVEGIDTAQGQAQALGQANIRFAIYFENMKAEQADAAQNAIECYQENMTEDLYEVLAESGSQFRNGYVKFSEMKGRVRVWPDPDAGLPQSPEDVRHIIQELVNQVAQQNPVAMAWFDVLPNQEIAMASLAPEGSVVPGAAQRSMTQQDIHKIVQGAAMIGNTPMMDPETGQPTPPPLLASPEPYITDYPIARDTLKLYMQENYDLKQKNPAAWDQLKQYQQLLINQDGQESAEENARKLQVTQAGMPKPVPAPPPDPTVMAARQDLIQKGRETVDRLDEIAHMPPQGQNGNLAPQVSAANSILSNALKAVTA